jgi:hypothetical protein
MGKFTSSLKSLALPKLINLFSSLPDPTANFFKKLQNVCFNFIWNGKTDTIKRTTLYNDYENGGLKSPHFQSFCRAQKLIWVRKLLDDTNWSDWKTLLLSDTEKHGENYIWLTIDQQPYLFKRSQCFLERCI